MREKKEAAEKRQQRDEKDNEADNEKEMMDIGEKMHEKTG